MLQDQIRQDMEDAMRSRDLLKLETLRMLISAMTNAMKSKGRELVERMDDAEIISLIRRELKKREEAGSLYLAAGRKELAQKEADEYNILTVYMPPMMSEEEVRAAVLKKKEDLGITDKKSAGVLIGRVMKDLGDKADGAMVKAVVDASFS